jgi:tetratricopeptide (TPR) repeat protein
MELALSALAFFGYCVALYAYGRSNLPGRDRVIVHVPIVAFFWFFAGWMLLAMGIKTGPMGALFGFFAIAVGLCIALPYVHCLLSALAEGPLRAWIGVERMTVERSYDEAGRAERERRLDDALRLYLEAAAQAPDEPEPHRRAAEVALQAGRGPEAIDHLRRAFDRTTENESRANLAFRLAELLNRHDRREDARALLASLADELRGTKYEEFARARLGAC